MDSERRTSCPWVFAARDVIGPSLASVATDQGGQPLCGALGLDFSAHVDQIPAAAIYGLPEVARAGKSEDDCTAEAIPYQVGRCELGATPRGLIAGTGVLLGVHAIGEIASEITGTGQAMIHNQATVEDVIRTAYNTPTYTYGYNLSPATSKTAWRCGSKMNRIRISVFPADPGRSSLRLCNSEPVIRFTAGRPSEGPLGEQFYRVRTRLALISSSAMNQS